MCSSQPPVVHDGPTLHRSLPHAAVARAPAYQQLVAAIAVDVGERERRHGVAGHGPERVAALGVKALLSVVVVVVVVALLCVLGWWCNR